MTCIKTIIGSGRNTLFWLDCWHEKGVLDLCIQHLPRMALGFSRSAYVDQFLSEGEWRLP